MVRIKWGVQRTCFNPCMLSTADLLDPKPCTHTRQFPKTGGPTPPPTPEGTPILGKPLAVSVCMFRRPSMLVNLLGAQISIGGTLRLWV